MLATVFLSLCLVSGSAGSNILLGVSRPNVSPDVPLTITCRYTQDEPYGTASLVSLILERKDDQPGANFTDLLSMSAPITHMVSARDGFEGQYDGLIRSEGESFLTAEYSVPSKKQSGEYRCEAHILYNTGHTKTVEATLILAYKPRTREQVLQENLDKCKVAAERDVIAEFDAKNDSNLYHVTHLSYEDSFYIFTKPGMSVAGREALCKDYGGYPAEINTEEELLFLLGEFQGKTSAHWYVTGARLLDLDNGPFVGLTHPEDPIYTGHWSRGQPQRKSLDLAWIRIRESRGDMIMSVGIQDSKKEGLLCEISPLKKGLLIP